MNLLVTMVIGLLGTAKVSEAMVSASFYELCDHACWAGIAACPDPDYNRLCTKDFNKCNWHCQREYQVAVKKLRDCVAEYVLCQSKNDDETLNCVTDYDDCRLEPLKDVFLT